ncbi:MAG: hypothetical protein U0350_09485 [Caldilineaceae bacterium]
MVAHKATYVRLYPKQLSGPDAINVEVKLTGTRNSSPLPGSPLQPINGSRSLKAGGAYDRANLNDGWLFQLPDSWTEVGNLNLKAEVDPRNLYVDPDRTNNSLTKQFSFQSQPPVCVVAIPVRTNNPLPSTNDANFKAMVSRFKKLWPVTDAWLYKQTDPVEELEACWWGPIPYPCYGPYELDDESLISDSDKVIISIIARDAFSDDPDECDNVGAPTHYMGMVSPNADTTHDDGSTTTGYANYYINASWVKSPPHSPQPFPNKWNAMRQSSVMAQELAHNYHRLHVNCGNPSDLDNSYPYPGCQLDNTGASNYYGFDVSSLTPIAPDKASDFMSYGQNNWVSDYTWRALMDKFAATTQATAAVAPANTDAGSAIFASGFVDETNNRGKLNYLQVLPKATLSAGMKRKMANLQTLVDNAVQAADVHEGQQANVNYHLQLLDAQGAVLSDQPLTLSQQDNHDGNVTAVFVTSFDAPVGVVAKAVLLADSTALDSLQPGSAAPVVSIQQPTGGAVIDANLVIQWTASDADSNDKLLFAVQYSYDNGGHWQTLVNDYPSTPNPVNTLTLADLGSLHGSNGNTAIIRVIASDGFNTTIATSQPFQVPNRAPEPYITAPNNGQWVTPDQPIILEGGANDAEDGGIAASGLAWSIDNGTIGNGNNNHAAGLAPGAHTVTLQATDSANKTGATTAALNIAPLGIPQTAAPTLDGVCNDAAYAGGVQLQLKPYSDSTQATVHLVRSSDRLWACFTGLSNGAATPGAFAGLRIDVNNSHDALAQTTDYGFFASEDGSVFTTAGDSAGGFAANGPGGLQAQISAETQTWSAELSVNASVIGGWNHFVGLALGHYSVNAAADDYQWPYAVGFNHPNTWAQTALGAQPSITALTPFTATVNSPAFTLAVEGSNFISGTTALWNGVTLPTTVVDAHHLNAQVDAAKLTSAGAISVTVHTTATFTSNAAPFTIQNIAPTVAGLTPNQRNAETAGFTLTVNGANFAQSAVVLWNGKPLPTTFVNATTVTAQVDAALVAQGQTAGVAVQNGAPDEQTTSVLPFTVDPVSPTPSGSQFIYLPLVRR